MNEQTKEINLNQLKDIKNNLLEIMRTIENENFDSVKQISAYLLCGDPTYITRKNDARKKILKLDRYEILKEIIDEYCKNNFE